MMFLCAYSQTRFLLVDSQFTGRLVGNGNGDCPFGWKNSCWSTTCRNSIETRWLIRLRLSNVPSSTRKQKHGPTSSLWPVVVALTFEDPGLVLQNADFVLVDMDQGALDYFESKLEPLGSFVKGNVLRLSNIPGLGGRKAKSQRMFDAVVVGGLFDYLSDRMIVKIVKYVYWELLAIGGTLFFTNIGTDLTSSKKTFFNTGS
jgi:hypothetical protein